MSEKEIKRIKKKYISKGPQEYPMVHFSGRVVESYPKCTRPVSEAIVEVAGIREKTDKRGYFRISAPVKNQKQKRFVLNIKKAGFGPLSKVYSSNVINYMWNMTKATIQEFDPTQDVILQDLRGIAFQNVCTGSLSSQVDWSQYPHRRTPRKVDKEGNYIGEASNDVKRAVAFAEQAKTCNRGITIRLPGNSLVDNRGNPPTSNLTATISTVDVFDPDSMLGDYTAEVDGKIGYMVTFGAGTITIASKDKDYQLKKGARAILEIPINRAQLESKPKLEEEIPLLIYDEKKGIWRGFGKAKLDKDRQAYVGEIDHLSSFNMDVVMSDQACIRLNTPDLPDTFDIEVSLIHEGSEIEKSFTGIDNVSQKLHVIYNLPTYRDVAIRAFSTGGIFPTPLCDTVSINSGGTQTNPELNPPNYPYSACQAETVLVRYPLVPVLTGFPNPEGTITLDWYYVYAPPASTGDGYILQESTGDETGPWTVLDETYNERPERSTFTTDVRAIGDYWYRVQAKKSGGNAISDVLHIEIVSITAVPSPTTLRIINNLTSENIGGIEWGFYNGIISVRVGNTYNDVRYNTGTARELLYANEITSDVANIELISPGRYKDFDVSDFSGDYYVCIICGWWYTVFDPYTYEFMYYQKKYTSVIDCTGEWVYYNKWNVILITQPYYDPEEINASRWLPDTNWPGHQEC